MPFDNYPFFVKIYTGIKAISQYDLAKISNDELFSLHNLMLGLWFVKDNSANLEALHLHFEKGSLAVSREWTPRFSNCSGEYEDTVFSLDDLDYAEKIIQKLYTISKFRLEEEVELVSGLQRSPTDLLDYKSTSRIDRAILFLSAARGFSLLPFKISNYIAVLECLFTTDSGEITHKVSERAALYIGGDTEAKTNNYYLIKSAYGLRSKFFHGQPLENKHNTNEKQKYLSKDIDHILRIIINRIINTDFEKFTADKKELDDFFDSLVFS